jgi:hypothetical protein
VGRAAGDHVGRQEDADVDCVCVVVGWDVLLQLEAQAVDTLEAVLAVFDDELFSQEDDEELDTAGMYGQMGFLTSFQRIRFFDET